MDRLHRKSAIEKTTELILATHEQGEGLLWGRYEQQLPLCAFTENGLSCRKCFHGPCRINPFGDEPSQGVCGADREQIVMENLFQVTLAGVLDTARCCSLIDERSTARELSDITADLPSQTQKRLSEKGLLPVRKDQLFKVQNSYFSHKGYLSQTLRNLTQLGLIHYGFLKGIEVSEGKSFQEVPPFYPDGVNILIVGQASGEMVQSLKKEVARHPKGKEINLLIEGARAIPSFYTMADHGTPELALAMNLNAIILGPDASYPALEALTKRWGIPVLLIDGAKPMDQMVSEAMDLALRHKQSASCVSPVRIEPSSRLTGAEDRLFERAQEIRQALEAGGIRGVVALFGETNVKQTFYERTLALAEHCLRQKVLVLMGGGLSSSADLINEELERRLGKELLEMDPPLVTYFGSLFEVPKLVGLLGRLTQGNGFESIPAVVSFPEFFRASTWATAVSLLSLGLTVQIGTRLPFWGSPSLTEIILQQWPRVSGGTLLVSPSLLEPQAQAKEIIDFLESRKVS
jgi:hydroxylamine reductase (hybrid-cluster protein)